MMRNKTLMGLAIALIMLALPIAIFATGYVDRPLPYMSTDDPVVAVEDNEVKMERLTSSEVDFLNGKIDLEARKQSVIGQRIVERAPDMERFTLDTGMDLPDQQLFVPSHLMTEEIDPTRATDKDNNNDLANGSKLLSTETVSGQLFIDTSTVNPQSDVVDWYKLEIPQGGVDPKGGSSKMQNYTLSLTEFTSTDIELSEPYHDGTQWLVDYIDTLEMWIYYSHYSWTGFVDMGGREYFYDNQVDSDGWTWDGNWSTSFRPVVDSQGTTEDTNGFTGTLTERGWYYIAVRYLYITTSQTATPRTTDYYVDYTFDIEKTSDSEINNFPFTSSYPSGAGNDWKNASTTQITATGGARSDSQLNNQDWYRLHGSDRTKLWNISFDFGYDFGQGYGNHLAFLPDNWFNILWIWYDWGDDMTWGTEDDDWVGTSLTWTWVIATGNGFINIGDYSGLSWSVPTNWTDAPATVDAGFDPRDVYICMFTESVNLVVSGTTLTGLTYGTVQWINDYSLTWSIEEIEQNNPPTIESIEIETEHDRDVVWDEDSTGYFNTEFTIYVTYNDVDNDPPSKVFLTIDPGTGWQKVIDITNNKYPLSDNKYDDGMMYRLVIDGKNLDDEPNPHVLMAHAFDTVTNPIKSIGRSFDFYLNDTLKVYNDYPVALNTNYVSPSTALEDDEPFGVPLEGPTGVFEDPEGEFEGFRVWNKTSEEWSDNYLYVDDKTDMEIAQLQIEEFKGVQALVVYPKKDMHGTIKNIKVEGFDLHSRRNFTIFDIKIDEVNDPPMVLSIDVDGSTYDVDNGDARNPFIILESEEFDEDSEGIFTIIAEDTDPEADRSPLRFTYLESFSDDWETPPSVGFNDGVVTFTPTNADASKNQPMKMVFNVEDGTDEVRLTVSVEVKNTNDAPKLILPPTLPQLWNQGDRIVVPLSATDEDKGDTLEFGVNFVDKVGDADPVIDQISADADLSKGRDWDINTATGQFWFQIDDQNIWLSDDGLSMKETVEIEFEFSVKDKAGSTVTEKRTLILKDVNKAPEAPSKINYRIEDKDDKTEGIQGLTVELWVDSVFDEDMDVVKYQWSFSDGNQMNGQHINYTFTTEGTKTVQVYAFDSDDESESISESFQLTKPVTTDPTDPNDPNDPNNPGSGGGDDSNMLLIILIVAGVLLTIIIIALLFFVMRKKPAPPAQIYGYDQQQLAAYQAQGLPPAQAGALPPAPQSELPPAPAEEGLQQDFGMAPEQQQMQPDMSMPQQGEPQPEAPQGMACPSCGSPVDPTWFLCPNCKAPLQ